MRKDLILPALSLAGGAAGFALRRWQLSSAFQPETGLFVHGAPATYALLALTGLMTLLFLLASLSLPRRKDDNFLSAFGCPQSGFLTALTAAGMLFLAAGLLGVREGLEQLGQWRSQLEPDPYLLPHVLSLILCALLALPGGVALLLLGKASYRNELPDSACRLAPVPALVGLVWLFVTHLQHGTEPVLMRYGFSLAAAALLMLAHYYAAGFLYGRPFRRRTAFCALLGACLGLISLADSPTFFIAALTLAFALSALALSYPLLHSSFGPPWPERMPSGAEGEDMDTQADI